MKKKNKLLTIIGSVMVAAALSLGAMACSAGGNDSGSGAGGQTSAATAKEVYAVSAFSGANYLLNAEGLSSAGEIGVFTGGELFAPVNMGTTDTTVVADKAAATERPSDYTDESVNGIKNCLEMFDSLIVNGGISQTVEKNPSDGEYGQYAFVMTVSTSGKQAKMYYNEVSSKTETEIDDDGEEEIEISTVLKGVIVLDGETFEVDGKKEIETEGDESEYSVEFVTKKDSGNYVKFSYSTETERNENEVSYECEIYKNNSKVTEIEFEIKEENGKIEIKFELEKNGKGDGTEYKITKKEGSDKFDVRHEYNGKKSYVSVEKTADGYVFLYSNGFTENVGF